MRYIIDILKNVSKYVAWQFDNSKLTAITFESSHLSLFCHV